MHPLELNISHRNTNPSIIQNNLAWAAKASHVQNLNRKLFSSNGFFKKQNPTFNNTSQQFNQLKNHKVNISTWDRPKKNCQVQKQQRKFVVSTSQNNLIRKNSKQNPSFLKTTRQFYKKQNNPTINNRLNFNQTYNIFGQLVFRDDIAQKKKYIVPISERSAKQQLPGFYHSQPFKLNWKYNIQTQPTSKQYRSASWYKNPNITDKIGARDTKFQNRITNISGKVGTEQREVKSDFLSFKQKLSTVIKIGHSQRGLVNTFKVT